MNGWPQAAEQLTIIFSMRLGPPLHASKIMKTGVRLRLLLLLRTRNDIATIYVVATSGECRRITPSGVDAR